LGEGGIISKNRLLLITFTHDNKAGCYFVTKNQEKKDLNPTGYLGDFLLLEQSKILRRFV
jgi:hypothetical protein